MDEQKVLELVVPTIDHGTTESFKTIRTNLIYAGNSKVVAVTSSVPDEGKSIISCELAYHFSLLGKKVILVDCDLKKPSVRKFFQFKGGLNGLSEYLTNQSNDIVYSTNIKNLHLIPSGKIPPDSAELLSGPRFERLINFLKEHYDYIIIDTPPATGAVDIQIVGKKVDGVLLITRANHSRLPIVKSVVDQLRRNDIRIIGTVFNAVKKKDGDYYYYYYSSYYNHD